MLIVLLIGTAQAVQPTDFPDNLTFTTFDRKVIDSAALKTAPLVLIIGASWCPECKRQAYDVQKAYLEYKDKGVQFLCVLGGSKEADVKDFIETYRITYPVARDDRIAEMLGARVVPQTFFFSKGGKFKKRIIGPASHRELVSNIEKIISK